MYECAQFGILFSWVRADFFGMVLKTKSHKGELTPNALSGYL